jgi:large repetitive protein
MTMRGARFLLAPVFALMFLLTNAFGQGSTRRMVPASAGDSDQDQPQKRAEWNMRGRIAPKGESAAALRLRAHQQKMAMRAQRAAVAGAERSAVAAAASPAWVSLGPSPLASDATGSLFQDYHSVSGRATSVLIDPADLTGNTVLVGGAYGGLWKSTNAGSKSPTPDSVTWQALIDDQPSLAVGAIALQPGNSNVILVGTGETNSSGDSYYGMGILRSTDGGATWHQITSAASGQSFLGIGFSKISFSTKNPNLVVATTAGDIGFSFGLEQDGNSTARGLYFSTDVGATWHRVTLSDGAIPASTTGLVYNPSQGATGTFYAAIRRHGIYSSTDGQTFTRLATQPTTGLASASCPANSNSTGCPIYRAELAVTPGRNEMYAWVVDAQASEIDGGIWTTTDGGTTWTQIPDNGITNCGDSFFGANSGCGVQQGLYNLELAAIPGSTGAGTDVYAGTINIYKCTLASGATTCSQAGGDWINLTHVYGCNPLGAPAHVHPDQHGLSFMVVGATAPGYFAHDGGISRTLDGYAGLNTGLCTGTNQFDSLSQTLGSMTEFVSFSVHPTSADIMLGGTQDNGSPKTGTATTSTSWQNALGGDGGFNAINPTNGNEWFASTPDASSSGFQIGLCELGTGCDDNSFGLLADSATLGGDHGAFYTPYILDPQNPNSEMFIGTCRVWRVSATGSTLRLSNNFDTLGTGICTGGEVNQVAGLAAGGPKDSNGNSSVVYATTAGLGPFCTSASPCGGQFGGGEVWTTKAAGTTMLSNVTGAINPKNYPISSVAIDTSVANGQTAYVGIMGFHTSHVWKTTNAGTSWTDWTGIGLTALPDAPVSALLVDSSVTPAQIYAGTDVGVFVSSASNASWTEVGPVTGPGVSGFLPSAPVTAIQMFASGLTKKLRASTYGRGIWEFALSVPDFSVPATLAVPPAANPGQAASTSMLISPVGPSTFGSNVTYTCSGLPTGASCSFNPTQINAGDPATSVTITIKTAGPFTGAAAGARPSLRAQNQRLWLPLSLPLASLLLVGLAGRRLPRRCKIVGLCLALALTGFLLACGGGSSSAPPPPPQISVTVSPSPVNTLFPNLSGAPAQTQQFAATVHNSTNQSVNWEVNGVTGGNATFGTIDASGNYTAPAAVPSPANFNVTAVAQADTTKSGNASVTIQTPTPSGTYPITVTVAEGAVSHTTTFNLTVN